MFASAHTRRTHAPKLRRRAAAGAVSSRCETLERRTLLSLAVDGGEFRVNSFIPGSQTLSSVAMGGDGNIVAVWQSGQGQDGSESGVYGQRYRRVGVPLGGEFRVNTYTTGAQGSARVAVDADGDFVVVWGSDAQDGSLSGIYAQPYNAAGVAQGSEFRVNTYTTNHQVLPTVAMDAAGNFVVAWASLGQEGPSNLGVYAQRYDFLGIPQGGEFHVNTHTTSAQTQPSVAMDARGNFVIAWQSDNQEGPGSGFGVYAQRYNVAGAPQGAEFRVNTFTTGWQSNASVAMDYAGRFIVAWDSPEHGNGNGYGVYAQRYSAAGVPQGGEFRVNTYTTLNQEAPRLAMDADGDFLIAWQSTNQDGSVRGVFAKHFDAAGVERAAPSGAPAGAGNEFRVNTYTTGDQQSPSVAMSPAGDAIITWHGTGAGDIDGVYAQRYAESTDTAGPVVAGVFARERRVLPYSTQNAPISQIVVSFSENMSDAGGAAGTNSVVNPANWLITRNGLSVSPTITYGFNFASNRFEAVLNLPGSFTSGNVLVKPRDNLRDIAGNRLDGDLDGAAGGVKPLPFSVAGVGPTGGEFKVNTFVGGSQGSPAVAMATDGAFIAVWTSDGQDGDSTGIYAQRYNATGTAQGGEFRVNTYTTSVQSSAAVAMDAMGNFVVAWSSFFQDGSGNGVYAQRYNAAGVAQGGEFKVNTFTTGHQQAAAVAMDTDGDFVVAWQSSDQDGSGFGIHAQRYNASGAAQGGEFQINTFTTGQQWRPAVAMDASGNFVVAWDSDGQDGESYGVYARRYNAAGAAQGGEFRVNTFTAGGQWIPSVAMDTTGNFVVAWQSAQDGSLLGIYAQRYDAAGVAQGEEFQVNTFTTGRQRDAAVAMDADGDFAVTWQSFAQDGDNYGVYARRYDAAGVAQTGEFRVNTFTTNSQALSSVAMNTTGNFVVAWSSVGQSGSVSRVYAQRYGLRGTPLVNALSDTPDPVASGNSITLTASGVTADNGAITSVSFYRESNGEPGLQVGVEGDTFIGSTNSNVGGFWSINVSTAGLGNGTYTYWAQATDDAALTSAPASTINTVIGAAPAVTASDFLFNTLPQRVTFTFNQNVGASLSLDDFVVQMLPAGPIVTPDSLSYDNGTNTATLAFGTPLQDGNYRATALAAGITNAGGTPLPADVLFDFFFLRGDANHDGRVNLQDFNRLAANFGQSGPQIDFTKGDFNYDGVVNLADFNILASRFGQTIGMTSAAARTGTTAFSSDRLPTLIADDEPASDVLT